MPEPAADQPITATSGGGLPADVHSALLEVVDAAHRAKGASNINLTFVMPQPAPARVESEHEHEGGEQHHLFHLLRTEKGLGILAAALTLMTAGTQATTTVVQAVAGPPVQSTQASQPAESQRRSDTESAGTSFEEDADGTHHITIEIPWQLLPDAHRQAESLDVVVSSSQDPAGHAETVVRVVGHDLHRASSDQLQEYARRAGIDTGTGDRGELTDSVMQPFHEAHARSAAGGSP